MKFNFLTQQFGLKNYWLYEILASTISINKKTNQIIPNTSCMGIRLLEDHYIQMNPYPMSQTNRNIEENGLVCVNFVSNIYFYTLAALKEPNSTLSINYFPEENYAYLNFKDNSAFKNLLNHFFTQENLRFPFIKEAWGILLCEKVKETTIFKEDIFGILELKDYSFKIKYSKKIKESYKLFNRAENKILEIIILATRLKVARKQKNETFLYASLCNLVLFCKNLLIRY